MSREKAEARAKVTQELLFAGREEVRAGFSEPGSLLSAYNSVKKKEGKTRVHQQADLVETFPKCINFK